MDNMENKVDYTIYREEVERLADKQFTDKEWEVLASEIESFIDYAIWQQMWEIVKELPDLVEQDSKCDSGIS